MNSSNPPCQSMDCVIKWGIRFINSIKQFFVYLKTFIMQQRKRAAEMRQKERIAKTDSASATP